MTSRQRKAILAFLAKKFVPVGDGSYTCRERKSKKSGKRDVYLLTPDDETGAMKCSCKAYEKVHECKHLSAFTKWLEKGEPDQDFYAQIDPKKKAVHPRDNVRDKVMKRVVMSATPLVVRALANTIYPITGSRSVGRPFTEMRDVLYCMTLRVLYDLSGDRADPMVQDAWNKGLLYRRPIGARPPSVEAITRAIRLDATADALAKMIEATNEPYRGHMAVVAVDGSEFNIPIVELRFAKRYNKDGSEAPSGCLEEDHEQQVPPPEDERHDDDEKPYDVRAAAERRALRDAVYNQTTVKLHAAVDTRNGFICGAVVTIGKRHDSTQAIAVTEQARRTRFVQEVLADKAYCVAPFVPYLESHGIKINIPPKANNTEDGAIGEHVKRWRQRSEADKNAYGYRQLVEAAFSRVKRLLHEDLAGVTYEAQRAELLCEVLIANVMWLIAEYIDGVIELPFLDAHCKKVLDPARDAVKDHPRADRTPRYRDGLTEEHVEAAA